MRSMTGYGAATVDTPWGRFSIEMRSVNHRFSEVLVRLPRELSALEDRVRALVQTRVQRGRVEVVVQRDGLGRRPRGVRADLELAQAYVAAVKDLAAALGLRGEVTLEMVASQPEVIRLEEQREDAGTLWAELEAPLSGTLAALVEMRAAEGARLADDMLARVDAVAAGVADINARSHEAVQSFAARLRQRLTDLLGELPIDEARLIAELALFAERSDISEEITRLHSHLAQFRDTLKQTEGPVGRKLEFVLQEMGRETNTIGSKGNDLDITRAVIAMKSELESLREQVQNVE